VRQCIGSEQFEPTISYRIQFRGSVMSKFTKKALGVLFILEKNFKPCYEKAIEIQVKGDLVLP